MIDLNRVSRTYSGARPVHALRDVDLSIGAGEYVAIMGPSGSGKSTLMNVMGCLDRPTAGRYLLQGQEVSAMRPPQLADVRNRMVGFVLQTFNLLPRHTAAQNVELPLVYRGMPGAERRRRVREVLERIGLTEWSTHRPSQLSGGQQQRVAIARALVGRPSFLLADEPTGNLDSRSGQEVMVLFEELNRDGTAVVLVTHDERIAAHASRTIRLFDGRIVSDQPNPSPLDAREQLARFTEQAAASGSGGDGS